MMRREFSSQRPASSNTPTSATSSSSSTTPTSATTASPAASSPIHLRRTRRRRTCRLTQRSSSAASSSSTIIGRQCVSAHARKTSSSTSALLARNPALAHKLRQMALPLSPLVQLTTGAVHPDFPTNVLQFWLLTDAQLESLAAFYHQATPAGAARPSPWAAQYPCPVRWRSDACLEDKRRRMGRFIGLRGCESPVEMMMTSPAPPAIKTEEEIAREARMARLAADEEALRRKTAPGPWGR